MTERERRLFIKELKKWETIPIREYENVPVTLKNSDNSKDKRKLGNALYMKKEHSAVMHRDIFKVYTKSIALAPNDSDELALAYGNRSAFLLHIEKYEECINDIDKALQITKSKTVQDKLQKRRIEASNLLEERRMHDCIENLSKLGTEQKVIPTTCASVDDENSVMMKYNSKYGNHLVANRDIKPGEIILSEEIYVYCPNERFCYLYCAHCLLIAWNGIPCKECAYFIFCSEKCRDEAWDQYHHIECCCYPYMNYLIGRINENRDRSSILIAALCVRTLMKGLMEFGSLEKFKIEVEQLNNHIGIIEDGRAESNTFGSFYNLKTEIPSSGRRHFEIAASILICLVKYTSFFGNNPLSFSVQEIMENSDMLFVGTLLVRISKILTKNQCGVVNWFDHCRNFDTILECRKNWCCVRAICCSSIANMISRTCDPNSRLCFTDDNKIVLYALKPIEKNSQLFDSYYGAFYESDTLFKEKLVKKKCSCTACKEKWPTWPISDKFMKLRSSVTLSSEENELYKEVKKIVEDIENENVRYDENLLLYLSETIVRASNTLSQPSLVLSKLMHIINKVFEKIYGHNSKIFDQCKQN